MAEPKDPMRTRIELLWGGAQRPSRGPKPKLTLGQIASTALGIADADGLEAVSMQRVAKELGYTAMSLYRYVPGKEQLVEVMMEVAAGLPPDFTGDPGDWRAELEAWVRGLWDLYLRHPWVLRVQISGPPIGPHQLAWFEAALRPLSRAGLDASDLVSATMFLLGAVRQLAGITLDMTRGVSDAGLTMPESEAGYESALRELIDADRFPVLAKLVGSGVFHPTGLPDSGIGIDLEFGVQRVLDGIEAYVRSRQD